MALSQLMRNEVRPSSDESWWPGAAPSHLSCRACRCYLLGAMHDGTRHGTTLRIGQREEAYVLFLKALIEGCGGKAWTYREGKERNLFIVEFSASFLGVVHIRSLEDRMHYARGYFDAEGGVPSTSEGRYLYFAQKDRQDLARLRTILLGLGLCCGRLHNPSRAEDPDYWRFYLSRQSIAKSSRLIGSWHPRKEWALRNML